MDSKGYLKTLEAVLAIVLILIFTFAVTPKPQISYETPTSVASAQRYILSEIENNDTIRTLIMGAEDSQSGWTQAYKAIDGIAKSNVPPGFDYSFGICNVTSCMSNLTAIALERSVYANDVLIASNGSVQNPKIIRLWMWRRGA